MRLVLTGARVTPAMLPDLDVRDSYFGGCDLSGLDLFFHDLTNATIFGCNVAGLRLPGVAVTPELRQAHFHRTRNHGLYMRNNTGWESLVLPAHIPWDNHEMVRALFHQRLAVTQGTTRRSIIADIRDWLGSSYTTSWVPGWVRASALFGNAITERAVRFVLQGHPELLTHWERIMALTDLNLREPTQFDNLRADLPPWDLTTLPAPANPGDRYDVERQVEAIYWSALDRANRCHIWSLDPLRMLSGAVPEGNRDDPYWWVGIWGG